MKKKYYKLSQGRKKKKENKLFKVNEMKIIKIHEFYFDLGCKG